MTQHQLLRNPNVPIPSKNMHVNGGTVERSRTGDDPLTSNDSNTSPSKARLIQRPVIISRNTQNNYVTSENSQSPKAKISNYIGGVNSSNSSGSGTNTSRARQYAIIDNRTTVPGAIIRRISSPQKIHIQHSESSNSVASSPVPMEKTLQEYYLGAANSVRRHWREATLGSRQKQSATSNLNADDKSNGVRDSSMSFSGSGSMVPKHPTLTSGSSDNEHNDTRASSASNSKSASVFTLRSPAIPQQHNHRDREYSPSRNSRSSANRNARDRLSASHDLSTMRGSSKPSLSAKNHSPYQQNESLSASLDSIATAALNHSRYATVRTASSSTRSTQSNGSTVRIKSANNHSHSSPPNHHHRGEDTDQQNGLESSRKKRVKRLRVYTSMAKNQVVFESIRSLKWHSTHTAPHADLIWLETSSKNQTIANLISKPHQKVSRFPGMQKCVSKYFMAQHLERMRRFFEREYDFVPNTYLFPDDVAAIYALENQKDTQATYIVKPAQGSQGNGITLTQNIKKTCLALETKHGNSGSQKFVLQRYLHKPYLLEGLKFDLRLYVLIESIDPLKIYIYEEGLTRMCTVPYTRPNGSNLEQVYMHLSNYSLNKFNEHFVESDDPLKGSKRSLKSYFDALARAGQNPHVVWERIKDMVVKTCIAILPDLKFFFRSAFHHSGNGGSQPNQSSASSPSHCFQLLGFDIMMDSKSKPWLLELNHHPSFTIEGRADEVKKLVVCRAMKVVAFDILYRKLPPEEKEEKRRRYMAQYCKGWELIEQCESKENRRLLLFSLDPLIDAFIQSCGVKTKDDQVSATGCLMVASKFYKFSRDYGVLDCPHARNQISRVQLDLLFIEAQKKASTTGGISYQQFLEILICLAKKMYQPGKAHGRVKEGKKHPDDLKCFLTFLTNHILNRGSEASHRRMASSSSSYRSRGDSRVSSQKGSTSRLQTSHYSTRQNAVQSRVLKRQKSTIM